MHTFATRHKKARLLALLGAGLTLGQAAWATNGDQRIGLNATQTGMGGAVVAAPEDAATVLANPAGLGELGVDNLRLDLGFMLLHPPRSINGRESGSNWNFLPTGAAAFKLDSRWSIGVGMSAIAGFGVDMEDTFPMPGNQAIVTRREAFGFSPGAAYKLDEQLSLGMSFNIYNQSLAMSTPQFNFPQNRQFGFGATLGGIYRFDGRWQMGLSYSSKQNMAEHRFNTPEGQFSLDLDGPATLAVGLAFKPTPDLVLEFDVKQIFFSDVRDSVAVGRPAGYTGGVPPRLDFSWSDQTVFALGMRKHLGQQTVLRAGLNYGAAPIDAEDVNANLGSVAIPEAHLSLGLTRYLTKNLAGNFSYTHAFKNELTSPTGNVIEVTQHEFNFQLSYAF